MDTTKFADTIKKYNDDDVVEDRVWFDLPQFKLKVPKIDNYTLQSVLQTEMNLQKREGHAIAYVRCSKENGNKDGDLWFAYDDNNETVVKINWHVGTGAAGVITNNFYTCTINSMGGKVCFNPLAEVSPEHSTLFIYTRDKLDSAHPDILHILRGARSDRHPSNSHYYYQLGGTRTAPMALTGREKEIEVAAAKNKSSGLLAPYMGHSKEEIVGLVAMKILPVDALKGFFPEFMKSNDSGKVDGVDDKAVAALVNEVHKANDIKMLTTKRYQRSAKEIMKRAEWSALELAVRVRNVPFMKYVLNNVHDAKVLFGHGQDLLHKACLSGFPEMVRLLLKHKASPLDDSEEGFTTLMSAVFGRSVECVKLLIQALRMYVPDHAEWFVRRKFSSDDPTYNNMNGMTALEMAGKKASAIRGVAQPTEIHAYFQKNFGDKVDRPNTKQKPELVAPSVLFA